MYENTDTEGNSYKLEITPQDSSSRAAQTGDSYKLTVRFRDGSIKINTGTVTVDIEISENSFILNPANATPGNELIIEVNLTLTGGVITKLEITGTVEYENDGGSVEEPDHLTADKTDLKAKIKEAEAAKEGVVVAAAAADVLLGVPWVEAAYLEALNTAIDIAVGIAADTTQTDVSTAITDLDIAIGAFNTAKKDQFGTKPEPDPDPVDRTALNAAIANAKTAKTGVVAAADNSTLAPTTVWVPLYEMTVFNAAITAAEAVPANAMDDDVNHPITGAVKQLNDAIAVFNAAKQTVPAGPAITYTVTFNSNGGSYVPSQPVEKNGTVTQPEDPTLAGSYFGGWYKDSPSTLWGFGKTQVSGSVTLHAKWLDETEANTADFGALATIKPTIPINGAGDWTSALTTINDTAGNYIVTVNDPIAGLTPGSITSASKVSFRGTGSLVLGSTNGSLITVGASATLILRGPVLRGKDNNNAAVVTVEGSGAKFIMESGTVTGNTLTNNNNIGGAGVYIDNNAAFTMKGGTVTGNTIGVSDGNGSGVDVWNGTFTMEGGTISGNTINGKDGGGVAVQRDGTFIMSGGTISGNTVGSDGGGVSVESGVFTMSGGTISRNTANSDYSFGGGVNVDDEYGTGTFTMTGGTISGNTAFQGGGVGVSSGTFTMSGGIISGNTARYGGGVMFNSDEVFTMSGGTVNGNTARFGGGVCASKGNFAMSGGIISGNTVENLGGGVLITSDVSFTKTDGTIYGATEGGNSNYAANGGHAVAVIPDEEPGENTIALFYRDTTSGPGHSITTTRDISD
jgi:hypothetical protein